MRSFRLLQETPAKRPTIPMMARWQTMKVPHLPPETLDILRPCFPLRQASLHLTLTRAIPRLPRVTGRGLRQVEAFLLEASHLLTLITRGLQEPPMEPPLALKGENSMDLLGETSTIVAFPQTGREVEEAEEASVIKGEKTQGKDTELSLIINQNVLLL